MNRPLNWLVVCGVALLLAVLLPLGIWQMEERSAEMLVVTTAWLNQMAHPALVSFVPDVRLLLFWPVVQFVNANSTVLYSAMFLLTAIGLWHHAIGVRRRMGAEAALLVPAVILVSASFWSAASSLSGGLLALILMLMLQMFAAGAGEGNKLVSGKHVGAWFAFLGLISIDRGWLVMFVPMLAYAVVVGRTRAPRGWSSLLGGSLLGAIILTYMYGFDVTFTLSAAFPAFAQALLGPVLGGFGANLLGIVLWIALLVAFFDWLRGRTAELAPWLGLGGVLLLPFVAPEQLVGLLPLMAVALVHGLKSISAGLGPKGESWVVMGILGVIWTLNGIGGKALLAEGFIPQDGRKGLEATVDWVAKNVPEGAHMMGVLPGFMTMASGHTTVPLPENWDPEHFKALTEGFKVGYLVLSPDVDQNGTLAFQRLIYPMVSETWEVAFMSTGGIVFAKQGYEVPNLPLLVDEDPEPGQSGIIEAPKKPAPAQTEGEGEPAH
ncbi:MAG: hypothetical protein COX57_12870 [Alphaproteobacteria bacterium CG_4_10_14_0_2_um_filter_63_37]|nr:MAG: hypothetical protein AUJ55_11800 [Proteobacteria bacterium CG1_02_64_396]PJA23599.1 MAG: hypothetical protein COX57_12870 [Alphaproteobacteria bacterium CG_4_10_14_0_2_um_filter_63_37]